MPHVCDATAERLYVHTPLTLSVSMLPLQHTQHSEHCYVAAAAAATYVYTKNSLCCSQAAAGFKPAEGVVILYFRFTQTARGPGGLGRVRHIYPSSPPPATTTTHDKCSKNADTDTDNETVTRSQPASWVPALGH